ncbi:NAD-dependent deacylase [Desulforhopalus sp. IMCC35007]|uniref:NAD-dependent deacylase n=1 Tax=Desulforhopalus sp. IMCC35007 TaxID=2569543 RepID=UPI0010AED441|nr:NAD-dependent deacylase [Desulforhopalus sp. IMCC35007]TKB07642.1 NAD-dependent deacylase [Desulforhopalus sp. IMCC35007]
MYQKIVILTGAGVSAESGLGTFRGKGGLWEGQRVEDVATPQAFLRNPELVQNFYNARRRMLLEQAQPNEAHLFLAEFERRFTENGGDFLLVTQNVDDLHDRAGSKHLIHMHGELLKARCTSSGKIKTCREDLTGTQWRPHIVWFGEVPLEMERIYRAIEKCDLFVAIGTSGHVYPAAGFVELAMSTCSHTVEINLETSAASSRFHEQVIGPATVSVAQYLQKLLL